MVPRSVFLSSTYLDLQAERAAVRDAVLRLRSRFEGMEYFGSDPELPRNVSLDLLRECDVYVAIVAHRYGCIDSQTGKSMTELEYDCARRCHIPTLIYEKCLTTLIEPTSQYLDFDDDARTRLAGFKDRLRRENTVQTFTSAEDLAARVTADLARLAIDSMSHKGEHEHVSMATAMDPFDFARQSVPTVPMLGPVGVGKTVYGCMLLHEPIALPAQHGLSVEIDRHSRLLSCYRSLTEGQWARKTSNAEVDTFADVTLRKRRLFGQTVVTLRIFDVSGERWWQTMDPSYTSRAEAKTLVSSYAQLTRGPAMVLFFEAGDPPQYHSPAMIDPVYANHVGVLAYDAGGVVSKPVAVVLTKCDRLSEALEDDTSAERYLAERYPLAFAQIKGRFSNFRVFAVSAVGNLDVHGNPTHLRPSGVWDPVVWLASEM